MAERVAVLAHLKGIKSPPQHAIAIDRACWSGEAVVAVQEVTRDGKAIFLMSGPATTALTGAACSPYGFHWTYDTHALATGTAMVRPSARSMPAGFSTQRPNWSAGPGRPVGFWARSLQSLTVL